MNSLPSLVVEWEASLDNIAPTTRINYVRGVEQFVAWLAEHHPDVTEPDAITRAYVRAWFSSLVASGKAAGTRRIRLISLRMFFRYLIAEQEMTADHTQGLTLPKVIVQPAPVPREGDVRKLLATATAPTFRDRRDALVIRLLADCGMRRAELVGIDLDDVLYTDPKDPRAPVNVLLRRTKGSHARIVPLSGDTVQALRKYRRVRDRHVGADGTRALLLTEWNRGTDYRLTGRGVAVVMTRRCRMAGVESIHPHSLRHLWAHDQLAAGVGESAVELLAGWTSPTMIRRYGASLAVERAIDASRAKARGNRF